MPITVQKLVVGITPGNSPQIATDNSRVYWGEGAVPLTARNSFTGWGRNVNYNLGSGYRTNVAVKPTTLETKNALLIATGYGQLAVLRPDHSLRAWGQNHAGNLPVGTGPEDGWSGFWEFREGLANQERLKEEGKNLEEIQKLEKEFALPTVAGKSAGGVSVGQITYPIGATCIEGEFTWISKRLTCGIRPGTDATAWEVFKGPAVKQFFNSASKTVKRWEPISVNKSLPTPAPQLASNVRAMVFGGVHGCALVDDGTGIGKVCTWGYHRYGDMGTGVNRSWGPKPRPRLPRPQNNPFSFRGKCTAGSKIITATEEISPAGVPTTGTNPTIYSKVKTGALVVEELEPISGGKYSLTSGVFPSNTEIGKGTELGGTQKNGYDEAGHRVEMTHAAERTGEFRFHMLPLGQEAGFWPVGIKDNPGFPVYAHTAPHNIIAVATGSNPSAYPFTLALTDEGEVLAWGSNNYGCMGNLVTPSKEGMNTLPEFVKESAGVNMKNIVAVACGETFCMALTADGKVWVWGKIEEGQGGKKTYEENKKLIEEGKQANKKLTSTPILLEGLPTTVGERPKAIAGSLTTCFVILENGKVMSWGGNQHGELGRGVVSGKKSPSNKEPWNGIPTLVPTIVEAEYISAGRQHVAVVTKTGKLWVWGGNESGQVGDGTRDKTGAADKPNPIEIYSSGVVHVACSEYNTFACLAEGVTVASIPFRIRLIAAGETGGEPKAYARLRWAFTPGISNWGFAFEFTGTPIEEAELENRLIEDEFIIINEDGEFSSEEVKEAEEDEEEVLTIIAQREAKKAEIPATPTEVEPGIYEWIWEPKDALGNPLAMTEQLGFNLHLTQGTSTKGDLKIGSNIVTNVTATAGLSVGEKITSVGNGSIPAGTTITRIGVKELELSAASGGAKVGQLLSIEAGWEPISSETSALWGSANVFGSFAETSGVAAKLSQTHLNGTGSNLHFQSPESAAIEVDENFIYFAGPNFHIGRCKLDGSEAEPEWVDCKISGKENGRLVALKRIGEKLFWLAYWDTWEGTKPRPVVGRCTTAGASILPKWRELHMGASGSKLTAGYLAADANSFLYVVGQAHGGEAEEAGNTHDNEYVARLGTTSVTESIKVLRWMKPDRQPVAGIFADSEFFYWRSLSGVGRVGLDLSERKNTWLELPGWELQAFSLQGSFVYWVDPGSSSVNRAALPEEAVPVEEPTEKGSTFTLKAGIDPNIKGTFVYGHERKLYRIATHLENGIIKGVTDESIRQGLRDLGIFQES
jgi:alpha-tubulin suppressor-like RCC1 family protein